MIFIGIIIGITIIFLVVYISDNIIADDKTYKSQTDLYCGNNYCDNVIGNKLDTRPKYIICVKCHRVNER